MRIALVTLAALVAFAAFAGCAPGGCPASAGGKCGAALVRWKLFDAATGLASSGCRVEDRAAGTKADVDIVALHAVEVASGSDSFPLGYEFACPLLEGTTRFELPQGTYRFSIEARACGKTPVGDAPPPVTRTVLHGEITNLSVIGIQIPPCTRTPICPDGGGQVAISCLDGGEGDLAP
ncbi:MAG: hypothetical protein EXR72_05345 [Myxococcales bacterium]|nr:hypothetical protein [Myxococcales bacterium]